MNNKLTILKKIFQKQFLLFVIKLHFI